MIFVPLPLFATLCLFFILIYMVRVRDMAIRANQLFVILVGLYALQSFLLCLRWGYGLEDAAFWIGLLAPILPVVAYFSYRSLANRLTLNLLWPLAVIGLNWMVLVLMPDIADVIILATYLSFGIAILRKAYLGDDNLALVRIGQTTGVLQAMVFTGAALVCSAFVDLFVIADFILSDGQNIGLSVTLIQTGFLLCIGIAAIAGQSGAMEDEIMGPEHSAPNITEEDDIIISRLTQLFEKEAVHKDTELNLRRLSRRLGYPVRSVSQAINKTQNMNVSQFVNGFRVRDACCLLGQTNQTILQISLAVGFLTKSNFNREFGRVIGQTPSEWRRSRKGSA